MTEISKGEQKFLDAWHAHGIPDSDPEQQVVIEGVKSDANRHYKFDFAWPQIRLAIEVDGHGWGHVTPANRSRDATKVRRAMAAGWLVIPVTTDCLSNAEKRELVCEEIVEIIQIRAESLEHRNSNCDE